MLLHFSPAGFAFSPAGLCVLAVLVSAWFGGAGPGFVAALMGTFLLPQIDPASHPLLGGFFDLRRFLVFSAVGIVGGWWSFRRRHVEAALRKSEERLALAVAGSYDGVWDIDFVARSVSCSARTRELCGLPPGPEPAPLDSWVESLPLHPDDRPRRDAAVQAHLRGETPVYEGEFRVLQPDGAYRWRRLHGVCIRDAQGNPQRMAGSISDVDARRRAEDALRESEERYEFAMNASDVGFWDWIRAGDKFYTSSRLRELYGFSPDTTFTGRDDFVARIPFHPEDRPRLLAGLAEHFAGDAQRYTAEARFLRDGEVRWVQISGFTARDAFGSVVRWTGMVRDVTERERAEAELRQSEERYALAMEAAGDGHTDWDLRTGEHYISPRLLQICGFEPGTTFRDRSEWVRRFPFHPEDRPRWERAVAAHFAGREANFEMELRIVVDAKVRWTAFHFLSTRDAEGEPIRWTGSIGDITERKLAEEGLAALERKLRVSQRLEALGTLAGGIAHDFNNILGAILGYGEMALRDVPKGSRLARDLNSVMIAGERGRALVDRVLAFSRSAVGERGPVHVERVVREAIGILGAKLAKDVTIEAQLEAGHAAMIGEPAQVHQVVMNLVINAIQALPSGGTIRVSLSAQRFDAVRAATIGTVAAGDYIVLAVTDSGVGMAPEILDRIFEPFFTTKEVNVGNGLGLSLVHGVVTEVDGAIDVCSILGSGSTFTVYLPRTGDAPASTPPEDAESSPRGSGQRVLIVDDEEPLVRLTTARLADLGYQPIGFTSAPAALEAFRDDPHAFDAVITDERMPGISGSTLIRMLRQMRPTVPILLVSGFAEATAANGAHDQGPDEVLKKPLSASDLATSLARALRHSGAIRQETPPASQPAVTRPQP
ncbi:MULTISPECIES: PAS domain-containing protein [unclassified Variovorax]|uniref:PAS domain-containing protein n=1 Tax=unclassified Variovorax TaxID=663243 RepID=UPI00139229C8|nr:MULTISPECIES: PAS domain-containing protein [unclassified Variovorax]